MYCRVVWSDNYSTTCMKYLLMSYVVVHSPSVVARWPCLVLCLLLGFPLQCWLRRRAGLLSSEEASGRPLARICCLDAQPRLAGGPRWIVATRGWCRCGTSAASGIASAELWCARSAMHRGRAFERWFFFLDVSKLVIPFLMWTPHVVGRKWSQLGKQTSFILISFCLPWSTLG